jgi:predicted metal-dependent hydrolase
VRKQRRAAFAGAVARGFSARVARKRAAEMVPLCIACRKPGGTVFRHTDHKHIAICGHATPCRLNIKIFGSVFYDLEELVDEYSREMEITKQEIIRQKMDALFNYVSDARAAAAFEDALDKYHAKSELFRDISEAHARVHANPHRRALLLRKEEQLGDAVERVRALMARFRDSGDRELLRAAVHAQVNDVAPAALTLRQLRHAVMESTPDPEHTERTILFQRAAPLADKVFSYAEPPQVVAFRV